MSDLHLTAAFKTNVINEAYIFMRNKFVRLNYFYAYASGSTNDIIWYGPVENSQFRSLKNTVFEGRIDCAFGSHTSGEAYLFARNKCALWSYPSISANNKIVKGPMSIAQMFPCLKWTVFENGVDAAFESSVKYQAYLFKGNKYARISYGPENPILLSYHDLITYWPIFKGTIFENGGFDAAFASHRDKEAYIFKGDSYARIKFSPGQISDELIGGVRKIKDDWKDLGSILSPRFLNWNGN